MSEDDGQTTTAQSVYDFVDDPKRLGELDALMKKHGLSDTPETEKAIDPMLDQIVDGKLKPQDIPARLQEKLKLSPEVALAFAKDFTSVLLFPLRAHFLEIERTIEVWNVTGPMTNLATSAPHSAQQVSANTFVHEELEKYGLELPDQNVQKKFERVLAEFVAKKRNHEETLDLMTRPRKVGGLGLHPTASENLLEGLSNDAKHVPPPPTRQVEIPKPSPVSMPKPLPPRTRVKFEAPVEPVQTPVKPPVFDPTTMSPDDDVELKAHEEKIPKVAPLHDIDTATERAIGAIDASKGLDEEGKKKLHAIVKTRLKGIRDPYKTRSALESSEGLAWKGGELSQALEAIENVYSKLEAEGVLKAEQEKRAYVDKRIARFIHDEEKDSGDVSQDTDGRVLPRALPAETTVQSPSLPQLKKKGKMRDVMAPRKLSGPIEELSSMTISDFRRWGSKAQESAEEVKERIGLLEEESYAKRLAGLSAWRRSPLYQTYVSVVSEAMQGGQSIAGVLHSHASSGEEMLTEEEVRALIKLNGTLRV
ncbi:MAG: Hedgehog/intein hint domain protein [Candidatus Giovannonibacteria bacterium GW2011_GWA2_53_7]|uniref:Hedgehog/intein hint domain protein n=1 Tax=Candidatus Giovannonibacteria bacterium GW2011_GWA2_53_7 TaxID=1618650 RepID=A0A0G1Y0W4_9BACT|nr:MAG: Hedgehog/intein hint domain protein [Candidatus Giovannonibacteria bacterium GW2011_GWA2_53_7]